MASVRRLPRQTTWLVCAVLGAASTAACGSGEGVEAAQPWYDPVLAMTVVAEYWPQAIVQGRLTEEAGCLLIGGSIAVFPAGTTWTSPSVTFPGGERSRVDTDVRLGGGTFDVAGLTQQGSPELPVSDVEACAESTGATEYVLVAPIN